MSAAGVFNYYDAGAWKPLRTPGPPGATGATGVAGTSIPNDTMTELSSTAASQADTAEIRMPAWTAAVTPTDPCVVPHTTAGQIKVVTGGVLLCWIYMNFSGACTDDLATFMRVRHVSISNFPLITLYFNVGEAYSVGMCVGRFLTNGLIDCLYAKKTGTASTMTWRFRAIRLAS